MLITQTRLPGPGTNAFGKPKRCFFVALVFAAFITGCGGGGDGEPADVTNPDDIDDELGDLITVIPEVIGSWQNTLLAENFWLITEDTVTSYVNLPPQPCRQIEATLLSSTTFTIDEGDGASTQFTMRVDNGQLILEGSGGSATHDSISETALPAACVGAEAPVEGDTQRYTDSFLQLDYPASWSLNADPGFGVSARFLAPETTESGGNFSCGVSSTLQPGSSLAEQTDNFLSTFNQALVSDTAFVTVNGTPMFRFNVNANTPSSWQLAYVGDYLHSVDCFGVTDEVVAEIFDSLVVF